MKTIFFLLLTISTYAQDSIYNPELDKHLPVYLNILTPFERHNLKELSSAWQAYKTECWNDSVLVKETRNHFLKSMDIFYSTHKNMSQIYKLKGIAKGGRLFHYSILHFRHKEPDVEEFLNKLLEWQTKVLRY